MKKTKKLKIWGLIQLVIAIILILLGIKSFNNGKGFGMLPIGMVLGVLSLPIISFGFSPELTKLSSEVTKETLEHAGKDLGDVMFKTSHIATPAIKNISGAVAEGFKEAKSTKSKEELLFEAKELFAKEIITKEEYEEMRKKILGI